MKKIRVRYSWGMRYYFYSSVPLRYFILIINRVIGISHIIEEVE